MFELAVNQKERMMHGVAVIRTFLNDFLGKELEAQEAQEAQQQSAGADQAKTTR
ncbi:hypothetical protein [Aeromonas fluvialis]|uniref:hypothetical protein n=1 Tax=Aeromonas fluvialis TaxID=591962 RepID=UPI000AA145DD|nr:hypothetical protein [Aeromonas fluvialis]